MSNRIPKIAAVVVVAIGVAVVGKIFVLPAGSGGPSKVREAAIGALEVHKAAETFLALEAPSPGDCPKVQDLVTAKRLDASKTKDPWGAPYEIRCDGDFIRALSPGRDGKLGTPDDVHDAMTGTDLAAVEKL